MNKLEIPSDELVHQVIIHVLLDDSLQVVQCEAKGSGCNKKGRREEGKKGRREEGKKGREVFEKVHNHKNCIFLQPEIILFSCISPHKYSKYSYIKGSMPIYSNS
jgi:hypothetical protein